VQLSPREELLVELFRKVHVFQRNSIISQLRSMVHSVDIVEDVLGKKGELKITGNKRMEAVYGLRPDRRPSMPPVKKSGKPQPRRPDRNQDDAGPIT
jgi:hypothetical protein